VSAIATGPATGAVVPSSPPQVAPPETPYKGLSYYTEQDSPFFFGREVEKQVISANLMASRLTLLYGESGVGKSSLLRAGVARHLREMALDNIARRGIPQFVGIVFPTEDGASGDSWRDDPLAALAGAIARAVESLGLAVDAPPRDLPLDELLAAWTELLRSDLLIILDQFEEYLLYHDGEDGARTLAADLPRALARPNLRASFVISIREDALARLDRFKGRIPTLFDNYLRVHHLDRRGAREAIVRPIEKYNELTCAEPKFTVEPELADTLLSELETGRVFVGLVGVGVSDAQARETDAEPRIETPYLQLVMTRLWKEELRSGSRVLRLSTLERLGHSERIVKTHLDETMRSLPRYARYVAARVFHHLVTPSGTKIAHTAGDLAAYVGLAQADVEPVLEVLTGGEYRILRRVSAAEDDDAPTRFEIFHDVLAAAILDWRARYLRGREALQFLRRGVTTVLNLAIGVGWIVFAVRTSLDDHSAPRAVFVVWGVCAVAMWLGTARLLAVRSRRRTAWVVPLVGIVASALGPITVSVALALAAVRAWSTLFKRKPDKAESLAVASTRWRGAVERLLADRVRTFSVLVAIVGGAVLLAGCFLPLYKGESALVALDERLWLALVPLVSAFTLALLAFLLFLRPPSRPWTSGLLGGLGIAGLAFFISYLGSSAQGLVSGSDYSSSSGLGPYFGVVGAGLIAVAAAPTTALEILAALVGAARFLGETQQKGRATALFSRRRMSTPLRHEPLRAAAGFAALAGAAIVTAACFSPFYSWGAETSDSLYGASAWLTVQPLASAVAAALIGLVLLRGAKNRRLVGGLLGGLSITSLTLFTGYLGYFMTNGYLGPRYGTYMGIAGAALLAVAAVSGRRPRAEESDAAVGSEGPRRG
jgi:Novel STAND NTPase 1